MTSATSIQNGIVKVFLIDGSYNNVRYDDATTIEKIIQVIIGRFDSSNVDPKYYGLRMINQKSNDDLNREIFWLAKDYRMKFITEYYSDLMKSNDGSQIRFELRIRYFSKSWEQVQLKQLATFQYFYDQVKQDYLAQIAPTLNPQLVLELGCIEIRRFLKHMTCAAFEKKSNYEFLEKEIGLQQFFPKFIFSQYKSKALKKIIQTHFRKYSQLTDIECCFRFLDTLSQVARFDVEIFKCFLGTEWVVPVDIVVGPDMGISYVTDSKCSPVKLSDFVHIQDIQISLSNNDTLTAAVIFKVATASEPLVISCSTMRIAENLADLINGYRMMFSADQKSVWIKKCTNNNRLKDHFGELCSPKASSSNANPNNGFLNSPNLKTKIISTGYMKSLSRPQSAELSNDELDADYSSPNAKDFELDRSRVKIEQLLGEGQFGDVFRGRYETKSRRQIQVAIKACKIENEEAQASSFLQEAKIMQQFNHAHIVKFIGVCLTSPYWIVMELARLGELRQFLIENREKLQPLILLSYCQQLTSALSYLESRKFVHRDIAARNILVFSQEEVKLSDFGLSRFIEDQSFYTASRGKLPIKWMAPESINFRRFTLSSDVWMCGVAMWEILSFGVKPFQGIRNHDVIHRIENGQRLARPDLCPRDLYLLMLEMWQYDPTMRPKMHQVREQVEEILQLQKQLNRVPSVIKRATGLTDRLNKFRIDRSPNNTNGSISHLENHENFSTHHNRSNSVESQQRRKSRDPSRFESLDRRQDWSKSRSRDSADFSDRNSSNIVVDLFEEKLKIQKLQCEEDSRWLKEEEMNLNLNNGCCKESQILKKGSLIDTADLVVNGSSLNSTSNLICRNDDQVYLCVVSVVTSINEMSKRVPQVEPDQYIDLVKDVGLELKKLLSTAEQLLNSLPWELHAEIIMAEQVLGSCMQKLVSAVRLAVENGQTTIGVEFRRSMLAEAHVLAVECKNFLRAFDSARLKAKSLL